MNPTRILPHRLIWRGVLCSAAALACTSCANVSHVMLYQDRHLGVKGGYNPETTTLSLNVGFRSNFATVIPKINRDLSGATEDYEAASVYSSNHMVVRGLGVPDIDEITATGDAAVSVARSADGREPFKK